MTSKKCSSKLVSKAVSKAFKRIFHHNKVSMINHISILQIKNYSIFQLFQLLIFPSPFLNKLKRLVIKLIKKLPWHLTFPFFYTKLPHFDLTSVLNGIIEFTFKRGNKKIYIGFSGIRAFWCHKPKYTNFFTKEWCRSGVFIVNFEHILHLDLLFLLLTLSL